ncbi:hypothetical protein LOTGIDRAFT_166272 [Lottia gigantea]|uniref:BZIP domain-containing protein n=1 Tax=Lottia gigantea TaxID=225164 RepID=V3ZYH0_LOTGI|nr:hypothetical protein LOTGIDRAFT_166272 [Lottia gigantea]ESO87690.1 hypothetical protein LOTGIDRAFT_166272 [Lottia gigantea]
MDDCYHSYSTAPDFPATSEQLQYSPTNQTQWMGTEFEHVQINTQNDYLSYDQNCPRQTWDRQVHPSPIALQTTHLERTHYECPFFDDSGVEVGYRKSNETELNIRHLDSNGFEDQYFCETRHGSSSRNVGENSIHPKQENAVSLGRWENETPGPCSVLCSRTEIQTENFQEPYYSPEISNNPNDMLQTHISEAPTVDEDEGETQNNDSVKNIEVDVDYMLSNGVTVAGFKPRPIIRKKKKRAVIQNEKDMNYWNRRSKNNDSARRSRETKKEKERLFYKQALQYEYENYFLKERILQLETQLGIISTQNVRDNQQNISQF